MQAFAPASKAQAEPPARSPASAGPSRETDALPAIRHDFSRIPIHPSPVAIQTKLTVNTPGDQYEQEADQVAEQVMRMPEPGAAAVQVATAPPSVQRKCVCGGTCSELRNGEDDRHLQRRAVESTGSGLLTAPPLVHEVLRSSGQPLDGATRAFMDPRMGFDMSRVRVHTGAAAAQSAGAVSAKAFTSGNDIVFGEGQYSPETYEGRKLLAHELTHVAQQRGGQASVQRKEETTKRSSHSKWGTAPSIVRVEAALKQTGAAWGYLAGGDPIPVEVLTNKLDSGQYTVRPSGRPEGPDDADYVQRTGPAFAWRQPVANFLPADTVTVDIHDTPADRFSRLPPYIRSYLLRMAKTDPVTLADEGERLVREGITAADIVSAQDPSGRIEMEGKVPPDPDLVESLRRRGFSDFPSREEYFKRVASELVNSSDYRRWWTKADIAAYWKEFPDQAAADWNQLADKRYTAAKQAEEAAWLEAFRRIDAAAGAVNAIAVVTLVVAGGFAGAQIALLPAVPALPATIQGVSTAVWGKTLFAAGLSASYLSHVYSRSK